MIGLPIIMTVGWSRASITILRQQLLSQKPFQNRHVDRVKSFGERQRLAVAENSLPLKCPGRLRSVHVAPGNC